MRYRLYKFWQEFTHRYNYHHMKPRYPDGDYRLHCDWCGIDVLVERRAKYYSETSTGKSKEV